MPNAPRGLGPTAKRVARNVRALRGERGLDLRGLADRLAELGQPIGLGSLSKLELEQRRVDVDDLAALAIALDVSPARLLMPAESDEQTEVPLTPTTSASARSAWGWASGESPLPRDPWANKSADFDLERVDRWGRENRPHVERDDLTIADMEAHAGVLGRLRDAARDAVAHGVPWPSVLGWLAFVRRIGDIAEQVEVRKEGGRRGQR